MNTGNQLVPEPLHQITSRAGFGPFTKTGPKQWTAYKDNWYGIKVWYEDSILHVHVYTEDVRITLWNKLITTEAVVDAVRRYLA